MGSRAKGRRLVVALGDQHLTRLQPFDGFDANAAAQIGPNEKEREAIRRRADELRSQNRRKGKQE